MKRRPLNGSTNEHDGNGNVTEMQNPGKLDFKKADEVLKKVVRENLEWLKEMASK